MGGPFRKVRGQEFSGSNRVPPGVEQPGSASIDEGRKRGMVAHCPLDNDALDLLGRYPGGRPKRLACHAEQEHYLQYSNYCYNNRK
jgi:hypothetical protein